MSSRYWASEKIVVQHFVVVVERALYLYGTVKNSFTKFYCHFFEFLRDVWGFEGARDVVL